MKWNCPDAGKVAIFSATTLLLVIFFFRKRDTQFSSRLCSTSKKDYADIANRGRAVFIDTCKQAQNTEKKS